MIGFHQQEALRFGVDVFDWLDNHQYAFIVQVFNVLVKTIDGLVHKRMGKPQYLLRDEFRKLERLYNNKPVLQYHYELRRAYLAPPL